MERLLRLPALALILLLAVGSVSARQKMPDRADLNRVRTMASGAPAHCLAAHRVGRLELAVANNGTFGREYHPGASIDWFTGEAITQSAQYPKNSDISYLFGGTFWIGAVVDRDTLVSVGADGWQWAYEMFPDEAPFGEMVYRSTTDPTRPEYEDAISEEDYIAVYTDTLTEGVANDFYGRPHIPLDIEVTQASYAWSYEYAEDFVLFDYRIKNIGRQLLSEVFLAVLVDCMVCYDCFGDMEGFRDDHSGFLHTYPDSCGDCEYTDTVFIAWAADDNGDYEVTYTDGRTHPTPAVTGTRIIRTPAEELDVSFNWWIGNGVPSLDFGPRERPYAGRRKDAFRDFGTGGLGTPEGDANKYYVMSNREFDYNQVYTGVISPHDTLWMYPNQNLADTFAVGYDTRYLLSFGPFDIQPGQTLPLSFAYVAGDSIHRVLGNELNLPDNPGTYMSQLDFSDLAENSRWAARIYDNPGVDTDGDGYFGVLFTCVADSEVTYVDTNIGGVDTTIEIVTYTAIDSCWIRGDDVPDFQGASPPPAPEIWVEPEYGRLTVRFNGFRSETARDVFSNVVDFEGYNVYLARDELAESSSLIASYDRENYDKFVRVLKPDSSLVYLRFENPFTLTQLRCLYGQGEAPCQDDSFDPLDYPRHRPYHHPDFDDSVFYFTAHSHNVSELGIDTDIRRRYPDAPYPDDIYDPEPEDLTEDGQLKYFEYEIVIDHLLASVPYWVNVTAFDFGSPESGLGALETSVTNGAMMSYPLPSSEQVEEENLEVYVWPNPYRIDGGFRTNGFEGRTESDRPPDRVRDIHFANLPPHCWISIYTLDGDLVRRIEHDVNNPPTDRGDCFTATTDCWNLITRNTQLIASGLYYFTIESSDGSTQIGKLVILM